MSFPQIWNIEKEKNRKKEQISKVQREKERQIARASDKKTKERNFVGRTTLTFYTGGKLEILAASKMKISGSRNRLAGGTGKICEKEFKQQLSTYETFSIKTVTRRVSQIVKKKVCCTCKVRSYSRTFIKGHLFWQTVHTFTLV